MKKILLTIGLLVLLSTHCFANDITISEVRPDIIEWKLSKVYFEVINKTCSVIYNKVDSWLTGKILLTYGEDGLLNKSNYIGSPSDATIVFNHDSKGRILDINWQFNNKISQRYSFYYN